MTVTVREIKPPAPPRREPPGRWDGPSRGGAWTPPRAVRIATWLLVGAIAMFFVALTSALLVRRASGEWAAISAPPLLWLTTVAIAASSLALERARAWLRKDDAPAFRRSLGWAVGLGAAFVVGQFATWRTLAAAGVYLATNPHSSYFYVLTGAHVVHLLGGFAGMALVAGRAARHDATLANAVDGLAVYWHFLAALWFYLFTVLFWI